MSLLEVMRGGDPLVRDPPPSIDHSQEGEQRICAYCKQIIEDEYVQAEGSFWCRSHFTCDHCNQPLGGDYFYVDEKKTCKACYSEKFVCFKCKKPLLTGSYQTVGGDKYHVECAAPDCDICGEAIQGNFITALGKKYHDHCWNCVSCLAPLESKFVDVGGKPYCIACSSQQSSAPSVPPLNMKNEPRRQLSSLSRTPRRTASNVTSTPRTGRKKPPLEQTTDADVSNAPLCKACAKPIDDILMTWSDQTWHQKCFVCTACAVSLDGSLVYNNQEKPYCEACHVQQFADRCSVCSEAISGEFIVVGEKRMHKACFRCDRCNKELQGSYFFGDDQVWCEDCT